ncbi:phosphotransferase [Streptomyces sp. 8ZJF_21]|uniref:phosphotransferase n=1 Tax=Streptomyces sp. 8ZJF_21 TaxID=2903141 RepID=UPI001E645FF3|nr:phosphotransferase [Streptomyces sp. 8ZJF_21]MCD9592335.1 phosphotransferase [Streptomyces sp. 8ZJF_21]
MALTPVAFDDLPLSVRSAIEAETGTVLEAEAVTAGKNSALSARVHTTGGTVFLKGLKSEHRWVWTQRREADINPYVISLAPRVLFHLVVEGWNILGFELLDGRHADYSPGSPDIPKVVQALRRLDEMPCPNLDLRQAEQRLSRYVAHPADAKAFAGDALLHTDWNNHNVLITGGRARLVDWGWATRGAAWLDPAYWIIWLIASGHSPAQAEEIGQGVPAWATAPPSAVDLFVDANAALWAEIAGDSPDDWTARLRSAAARWQRHRRG